ncbi:acyl-CoA dehydrogenase family protein [Mycobacterium seoulense]|uniref:acyl-CoA dehydrogenase family protein n=1 Tax=Mycobacterium seoulense TaxID=386911 RepID=UPI003CF7E3A6
MEMSASQEQLELAAAAAEFCAEYGALSGLRERADAPSAVEPKVWHAAAELGFLGLSAPEHVGGQGLRLEDHALVFRELGKSLLPGPFVAGVVAAELACQGGDAQLGARFVDGSTRAGVVNAVGAGVDASRLTGAVQLVDAADAEWAVVGGESGIGLIRVADLADVAWVSCIDPGSRIAGAHAAAVPVSYWAASASHPALHIARVLAAAQLAGIAERALAITAEHAKTRIQFGRPIGVNQAVKHRCADMAVAADAALQQTLFAAVTVSEGHPDAELQTRAAKFIAGRAAIENSASAIHLHGGMGFTYEHDIHLYLERAHVLNQLFGSGAAQLGPILALPQP